MLYPRSYCLVLSLLLACLCLDSRAEINAPIRVACVGDSITAGVYISNPSIESYPAQLRRMLGEKWEVQNCGASGSTLMNLDTSAYQKSGQFRSACEYKPDVIVIMLGTNDTKPENWKSKEKFIADYKDLIQKFKALNSKSRLFMCHPPAIFGTGVSGINEAALLDEMALIDAVAKDEGIEVIDVHAATVGNRDLFSDGVHPNVDGAHVIASTVFKSLTGQEFAGKTAPAVHSVWEGFECLNFKVNNQGCILVLPKAPAPGNPWIWRTEFFGAWPQADLALLKKGYHVAYTDVQNLYGAPVALDRMDVFYEFLRNKYHLADKVTLEGFSRGGLFAFNWAARHPERVSCLYVDAPVCDFKSWPGGKGRGKGSSGDWASCLRAYGLTEEQALTYSLNPVDNLKPLADAKLAILSVCGDADDTVPLDENTALVEKRYREMGGEIKVIVKPGIGHHPHSLEDPTPIVDFVVSHQKSLK